MARQYPQHNMSRDNFVSFDRDPEDFIVHIESSRPTTLLKIVHQPDKERSYSHLTLFVSLT